VASKRHRVTIHTDGGADPNPGPGGWGAVMVHRASGKERELHGGEPHTTNNRMELTAAIRALETLKEPCEVLLVTDSQYLRRGVTEWLAGWRARGWRRRKGELKNVDLWRRLAELIEKHDIQWRWVKGHSGERHNERADALARRGAREQRRRGPRRGAPASEVLLKVSCSRGSGGWAALVRYAGEETALTGRVAPTTSNYLDLEAAATALESLPEGVSVAVYTASDYLRQGASKWLEGWRRRSWKTRDGSAVRHRRAWERLAAAMARRRVTWPPAPEDEEEVWKRLGAVAKERASGS
jgi:ribonuclease HI